MNWLRWVCAIVATVCMAPIGVGQSMYGPPTSSQGLVQTQAPVNPSAAAAEDFLNPASMLGDAAEAIPGFEGGLAGALNIMVLLTVLALAPAILVMTTCFVRIIVVLGLLKQAMGTQQLPPSQVVLGLSLIMTFMVMAPTFDRVRQEALIPYQEGEFSSQIEMWERAKQPMRDFMFDQIEASGNWSSVYLMLNYQGIDTSDPGELKRADVDTMSLTCAFMLSELKIAFLMGFKIYLPFLIIDMVIASILISMSMMMLPPVLISLPFKVLLFILVDGWTLIVGSLLTSFAQPDTAERLSSLAAGGG